MKELKDMSLAELWALFPIVLREHSPAYAAWYEEARADLLSALSGFGIFRVSHIGSTAVPGLLAKPIVDILLELREGFDGPGVTRALQHGGWLLMSEGPADALDFNRGYTAFGFAEKVFHLHLRHRGDWGELYFRDYLRGHAEARQEYAALKRGLRERFEHDRDAYTAAKTAFVRTYTQAARAEFGARYAPEAVLP